jgi:hypothetical protein
MKRVTAYLVSATLGMVLFATGPAAAMHCHRFYSGYYGTTYPYGGPYPYNYSAWNYGWGAPAAGLASVAAAPFEVAGAAAAAPFEIAGAAATAPFAVAANTQAPLVTGRSVAVEQPYYAKGMRTIRHARYIRPGIATGRSVAVESTTRSFGPRIHQANIRHLSSRHLGMRHMTSRHASMAATRMSGAGMRTTANSY